MLRAPVMRRAETGRKCCALRALGHAARLVRVAEAGGAPAAGRAFRGTVGPPGPTVRGRGPPPGGSRSSQGCCARVRFSVSMSKCESRSLLGRARRVSRVSPVCILCMHTVHIMHVGSAYYARRKAPKVHIMHAGYAYYARGKCPAGRACAYYAFSAFYACGSP